jgi:cysteine desulfurase
MRDRLESELLAKLDGVGRNGPAGERLAGIANLSFAGTNAERVMAEMPQVAVSSSAACTSAAQQPSYVLSALGHDHARIEGSIRFSLGRFTTEAEIDAAVEAVVAAVKLVRGQT